jgi:hypothetical protein
LPEVEPPGRAGAVAVGGADVRDADSPIVEAIKRPLRRGETAISLCIGVLGIGGQFLQRFDVLVDFREVDYVRRACAVQIFK